MHTVFQRSRSVYIIIGALLAAACDSNDPARDASRGDSAPDMAAPSPDGAADQQAPRPDDSRPAPDLTWIAIPTGSFLMGCSPGDPDCLASELPAHQVQVAAFQITVTEVTQAQYEAATGKTPSTLELCPSCPVDAVTWDRAHEFCAAAGGRLPSEAEWEFAARGGAGGRFPCGENPTCLEQSAWYLDNAGGQPHPVGQKQANQYGLHDTLGNLWEWVADCWHEDYQGAPADGSAWETGDCTYRTLRGGAWGLGAAGLRVSNRDADFPEGGYYLPSPGFRCARISD